jgi:hypothetical protein
VALAIGSTDGIVGSVDNERIPVDEVPLGDTRVYIALLMLMLDVPNGELRKL